MKPLTPVRDIGIINAESLLPIWIPSQKRVVTTEHKAKTTKMPERNFRICKNSQPHCRKESLSASWNSHDDERVLVAELGLLTAKKFIYIINVSDVQPSENWTPSGEQINAMGGSEYVVICK